jgi:putative sigma-54 modulation protein
MKIEFSGKNLKVTEALREKVEKKLQKLEKFTGKMVSARITLEVEKHKSVADLVVHCSHDKIFKAKGSSEDMYLAINDAADAIEQQAKKAKGKIISKRVKVRKEPEIEMELITPHIEKSVNYIKKDEYFIERPMSFEDALVYLEDNKYPLVMFRQIDTDSMCVLFKKENGEITVVEEKD